MQPYSSDLRKSGRFRVFLDSYHFQFYGHTKYRGYWNAVCDSIWFSDELDDYDWYANYDDDYCDKETGEPVCGFGCGLCSVCMNMDPDNLPSLKIRQALATMHHS